jgi:hypothetical protein
LNPQLVRILSKQTCQDFGRPPLGAQARQVIISTGPPAGITLALMLFGGQEETA